MSSPFVGEIRMFPFNFAPRGWAFCYGQLLPISAYTALFSLLGTYYGGDGKSNFALPNLQGAVPMHTTQYNGNNPFGQFPLGETGGSSTVTLLTSEMPAHAHVVSADVNPADTTASSPASAYPARTATVPIYSTSTTPQLASMNPAMISIAGSSTPHNNLMPYLCLNYCIAMQGIYPPRS